MQDTWHIVKWISVAVVAAYFVVQMFALWQLKGDQRRRSKSIFRGMLILVLVEDTINSVLYPSRIGSQVGMLVVGVAAIVAIVVLAGMFSESPVVREDNQQDERKLQSLNLG